MTRHRILIVDDDPIARAVYTECLERTGREVVQAEDAQGASAALARAPVDVVVTDLLLPDGDGLDVLAEAKRRDPGVEVVVITAVDRVDPAVTAIKSGAADYLVKPVQPEVLELSVSRCLATRQLLQENALLRQHLALLETGQRLAATRDRDQLLAQATRALGQALSASAAVLLEPDGSGRLVPVAQEGLEPDQARAASEALAASLASGEALGPDWRVLRANGAQGGLACACLLRDATSDVAAWTNAQFLARHVALALESFDRLREAEALAYVDDLTGLHNLRSLQVALERELARARQGGAPFAVLFMDLDCFKTVNDTHGHLAGSKVLVEVAGVLRACVRESDVVARYGGDEYVILLRESGLAVGTRIAERIRSTIEGHPFLVSEGLNIRLTICVGVAAFPDHGQDVRQVLDAADRAMYAGKQSTRNRVTVAA